MIAVSAVLLVFAVFAFLVSVFAVLFFAVFIFGLAFPTLEQIPWKNRVLDA